MLALLAAQRPAHRFCLALATIAALVAGAASPARAQVGSERYSSIVIDAASGNVLSAANPDELRFPASLTKMMTLYMLFEAVRDHRVGLNEYVPVSPAASSMAPTKLGLVPGSLITVEQCILGLVTRSANDAAAALGELLGGDEDRFAQMMTLRAHALGMAHTTFRNASGLPDWGQVTTARDMAILARHLVQDFPNFYHYFDTPAFMYGGHLVRGHNALTATYPGADGLKTGYTDASGFNVVTSAVHGDTRLIGVVIGAGNSAERNAHMANLLDLGFDRMGVPPVALVARREPAFRVPSFIGVAHAAPAPVLPRVVQPRLARATQPVHRAAPYRGGESRYDRAAAPAYAERAYPAQIRPAAAQVAAPRGNATRTAHSTPYLRYPG